MRSIIDQEGQSWDVSVGKESYGMQVLLFFPKGGGEVRKTLLAASTQIEGEQELAELDDAQLLQKLADSQPWASEGWRPGG